MRNRNLLRFPRMFHLLGPFGFADGLLPLVPSFCMLQFYDRVPTSRNEGSLHMLTPNPLNQPLPLEPTT